MNRLLSGGKRLRKLFAYREVSVFLIFLLELLLFYLIIDVYIRYNYFIFFKTAGAGQSVFSLEFLRHAFSGLWPGNWEQNSFLSSRNLSLILRYSSFYAIATVGAAMIIISEGIDLSPGSVMALTAVVTGYVYVNLDQPLWLACLAGLAVGVVCGTLAAAMIVKINLLPFIATLGIMGVARGLAYIMMAGKTYIDLSAKVPRDMLVMGYRFNDLLKIVPVILMIIIALSFHWFMVRHRFGRQIHAVGGNQVAARFSGVKVGWMKTIVYMTGAILAAVSGLILAVVEGNAQQSMAMGYELDIIAAAVVGGASLSGGKGSILGAVVGALIFGGLRNGLNLIPNASYYERFIVGIAVVVIVVIDQFTARRQARMK
jgi:ribose/xylose/arabinose/galactoside ABC-type transport system permease subunit